MSYQEAKFMFGDISPLMIPYWACLSSSIPQAKLQAASKVDVNQVWALFDEYLTQVHGGDNDVNDPPYPPGPRIIAQMLIGDLDE